jgi:hypothetical protein
MPRKIVYDFGKGKEVMDCGFITPPPPLLPLRGKRMKISYPEFKPGRRS